MKNVALNGILVGGSGQHLVDREMNSYSFGVQRKLGNSVPYTL